MIFGLHSKGILLIMCVGLGVMGLGLGYYSGVEGKGFEDSYLEVAVIPDVVISKIGSVYSSDSVLGLIVKGVGSLVLAAAMSVLIVMLWVGHHLVWIPQWVMNPFLDIIVFLPVLFALAYLIIITKQIKKLSVNGGVSESE